MAIKLNVSGAEELKAALDATNEKVKELRMLLYEVDKLVLEAQAQINLPPEGQSGGDQN